MTRRPLPISNRRDPFESVLPCSLLFGGAFLVVAVIKLVGRVAFGSFDVAEPPDDFIRVLAFLVGFFVLIGPIVAFARRRMGPARSFRAKNLVTGGLVAACYSLGCIVVFAAEMAALGKIAVGTFTLVGVWWAITSGLNEVLS